MGEEITKGGIILPSSHPVLSDEVAMARNLRKLTEEFESLGTVEMGGVTLQPVMEIPLHHLEPVGKMPASRVGCAAWVFAKAANILAFKVPAQVTYEGEDDVRVDFMQCARGVCIVYRVTLDELLDSKLMAAAKAEAERCDMEWSPLVQTFLDSAGGTSELDRDPDKVGQ